MTHLFLLHTTAASSSCLPPPSPSFTRCRATGCLTARLSAWPQPLSLTPPPLQEPTATLKRERHFLIPPATLLVTQLTRLSRPRQCRPLSLWPTVSQCRSRWQFQGSEESTSKKQEGWGQLGPLELNPAPFPSTPPHPPAAWLSCFPLEPVIVSQFHPLVRTGVFNLGSKRIGVIFLSEQIN